MAFVVAAFSGEKHLTMVGELLAGVGHTPVLFATGRAAVAEARAGLADVLIVEDRLPDMTAREVRDAMRSHPSTAGIPIVVCEQPCADDQLTARVVGGPAIRSALLPAPLRAAIAAALAGPPEPGPAWADGAVMTALLVEDDDSIAEPLIDGLARYGIRVHRVATGTAALSAPRADIVLLDLGLPDIDGLDVCRELRRSGDTPVIMLTARGDEADRVSGLELGADDYLAKPFSIRELVARMRAVTRRGIGSRLVVHS